MALKQVADVVNLFDGYVQGQEVADFISAEGLTDIEMTRVESPKGFTDFLRIKMPGTSGKTCGGKVPTLGIVGRLGGIGARPERIGMVSDADGAVTAIACALKLGYMARHKDQFPGDVIICTHICPSAPTVPHDPVPFMDSPVDMLTLNAHEVSSEMDAILSVDTTKGNRILNHRGIAITATVKEGYILPVSDGLLDILMAVTGCMPHVLPISTTDITPYGNGLFHLNSIMQPSVATSCPVVGVPITAEVAVPGCATGASHETDIAMAVRFCLETAKEMRRGLELFYDKEHFDRLIAMYGPMNKLQTMGGRKQV